MVLLFPPKKIIAQYIVEGPDSFFKQTILEDFNFIWEKGQKDGTLTFLFRSTASSEEEAVEEGRRMLQVNLEEIAENNKPIIKEGPPDPPKDIKGRVI